MKKTKSRFSRQNIRSAVLLFSWLLFPIVMNFMSPYVIIDGAFQGIISGSFILFGMLFISALFVGRLWCGWACPAAGLQEAGFRANNKPVNGKRLNWIKWVIWVLWLGVIIFGAVTAGGFTTMNALHLTDGGISVDAPEKYVIYYAVTGTIFALSVFVGKRAFCHSACWMAPFMISGRNISKRLRTPYLHLIANAENCSNCKTCSAACTMSLDVNRMVNSESMDDAECILCGQCVDSCPNDVIYYRFA